MKRYAMFTVLMSLSMAPVAAAATNTFEYTATGPWTIPDVGVQILPLTFDTPGMEISDLELEINGLSHDDPADLNIFLTDPFGTSLQIMNERGDQVAISNVDLRFNDLAVVALPVVTEITSGLYLTEEGPGSFAQFTDGGTNAWLLIVIDGAPQGSGSLDSFTLRGTVVPEPATLSLLGLGALAVLRRKRR